MDLLRQTWAHQYSPDANGPWRLRPAQAWPPAGRRLDAPDAPEALFGTQRHLTWTGDTGPLTAPCAAHALPVLTQGATTEAAVSEVAMPAPMHQA